MMGPRRLLEASGAVANLACVGAQRGLMEQNSRVWKPSRPLCFFSIN
jgi:hypothetical protein